MFLFIILHHSNWDRSYEWSMLKNHRPISHKMGSFLREPFFPLVNIVNNKSCIYSYTSVILRMRCHSYIQPNVWYMSDHSFDLETWMLIRTQ